MNIEQVVEVLKLCGSGGSTSIEDIGSPWSIGKNYFIRTVTMSLVGRLVSITDKELVLGNASWIADTGRFHNALRDGDFDEIEPFVNDVIVNRGSIIDATIFSHSLPKNQK